MNDLEKFNKASLSEEKDFYSHQNMEDITDANYTHAKRVCKGSETKHLGEQNGLYVQSETMMLADVFENFWNISLEIYELDPDYFLNALVSERQGTLKKIKVKVNLFTDIGCY